MVSLAAIFALAIVFIQSASAAFASIDHVEVNGVQATIGSTSTIDLGTFTGDNLPVRVTFTANANANDTRIKVWLSGEKDNAVSSDRFDTVSGSTYSRLVSVNVPSYITDLTEPMKLEVSIENRESGVTDQAEISLTAQRESYVLTVLDANLATKASAGDAMPVDIVLKNTGSHLAEDTFVTVRIPALGVEQRAYFGDLSATDQSNPDMSDAVERRMLVNVPKTAPAGVYTVEVEAYNADSDAKVTKKVSIVGASDDTDVISTSQSKAFAAGDTQSYSLTLVNSGNKIRVYELVPESSDSLTVSLDEPVVALSAGTSKTVKMDVKADKAGKYEFAVNVYANGELVKKEAFTADVVKGSSTSLGGSNTTVLLTVVLAIIFVVLLVVLIVLLTRKPQKTEEFGESYY